MKKSWLIVGSLFALIILSVIIFYFFKSSAPIENIQTTTPENLVLIEGYKFIEPIITIKVGETVTWINKDSTKHTVTSETGEELNSNLFGKGESYSHKFNIAGTYNYYCVPHPSMKGIVVVAE